MQIDQPEIKMFMNTIFSSDKYRNNFFKMLKISNKVYILKHILLLVIKKFLNS